MRTGDPKPPLPEKRSMNEQETLSFVRETGIQPLLTEDWKEGQPMLYVLTEDARRNFNYAKDKIPSIARLYKPSSLTLTSCKEKGIPVYAVENPSDGRIDYYAINLKTKEITLVRTGGKLRTDLDAYFARADTLFQVDDKLFPDRR